MKKVRINNVLMPIVFNGENIVIALDPSIKGKDQRKSFSKHDEFNPIVFTEDAKFTKPKRRRIKLSPFINQ